MKNTAKKASVFTRRCYLLATGTAIAAAAERRLQKEWLRIADATDGTVGVAALQLSSVNAGNARRGGPAFTAFIEPSSAWLPRSSGAITSLNGDESFPLASVCKIPIAMHILALVDEQKLALDKRIEILPRDVWAGVSDIEKRWPAERYFRLDEMIELMVAKSDNTAVEALYRIGGGGPAISRRFREWSIHGIRVDRSERQCALDRNGVAHYPPPIEWNDKLLEGLMAKVPAVDRYRATLLYLADPRDTGTPNGTAQLLARIFHGELLSRPSTAFLIKSLTATTTFPTRLKGLLPSGTVVAHKTGSTGTVNGLTAATNDSGVIFLPSGGQLAVSIYVKASTRSDFERDRVIARLARAAYDFSR